MGFLRNLALASLAVSTALADGLNARAALLGKYMGIDLTLNELRDSRVTRTVNNRSDFGFYSPVEVMKVRARRRRKGRWLWPASA